MQVGAVGAVEGSTASKTMADMPLLAASKHGPHTAIRHHTGSEWVDTTYEEFGTVVSEAALGLIDLGIEHGDRVAILSNTRPEWTYANFAAASSGASTVSIYQTNSPEECRYVLAHSDARLVFVEDLQQLEKITQIHHELPSLEFIVAFEADGLGDAISFDALRQRGRLHPRSDLDRRIEGVTEDDPFLYIYTSGTTGPPKGCVLTHGNYRQICNMTESERILDDLDEVVYLFLPLAHAFALLVQLVSVDLGTTIAYWRRDTQKIIADLSEIKPTYFPAVPRIFEKIYTLATSSAQDPEEMQRSIELGVKVRRMRERGEAVSQELSESFDRADAQLYANVRNLFGGRVRQCVTGAAPIAPEILEFFYACGVPVLEGYGMTETSTVATANKLDDWRFGSVGKPLPGVEAKVSAEGELLLRGANIFSGYHKDESASHEVLDSQGWLYTGDLGYIDEDGFVYITGRKKDIIITAGGKNITPANMENALKQTRWISQALVVGDRQPYLAALVTLDPEEIAAFAQMHSLQPEEVYRSDEMQAEVQRAIDEANANIGRVAQIKRFTILESDLTQAAGELTPTLKVKRNVVINKYADEIERLYAS
jgi:long-chain acyl-CoA synthetase